MKKKPIIITVAIVAVAAILIGGGIYLYPHVVEQTISQVVDNDMTDIVEIELMNGDNGRRAKITDKDDINEITGLFKNVKVKKAFNQAPAPGSSLGVTMTASDNEKIHFSWGHMINDEIYDFNCDNSISAEQIKNIEKKYGLESTLRNDMMIFSKNSSDNGGISDWEAPSPTTISDLLNGKNIDKAEIETVYQYDENGEGPDVGGYVYLIDNVEEYISRFDNITLTNHGAINVSDYNDEFYIRFYENDREILSICPADGVLGITYYSYSGDNQLFQYVYYDYNIGYDKFVNIAAKGYMS